jgi:hypothetical protein
VLKLASQFPDEFTGPSAGPARRLLRLSFASEMEIEDGVIWVYGVGEDGVLAFTDFGIESLIELIRMYKDDPTLLKRYDPQ